MWKWLEEEAAKLIESKEQRTKENEGIVMEANEVDCAVAASENDNILQQMMMISDDSDDESADPGDHEQAGYARSLVKNEISHYKQEKELEGLPNHPVHRMGNEVLLWWKARADRYPNLSALARRILAIPATSAPSERLFSQAMLLISKKRVCLTDDNVSKLIFFYGCWELVENEFECDGRPKKKLKK